MRALVLVPTKELTQQAVSNIQELVRNCSRSVSVLALTTDSKTDKAQRAALKAKPDIVVGTPTAVLHHLAAKVRSLAALQITGKQGRRSAGVGFPSGLPPPPFERHTCPPLLSRGRVARLRLSRETLA